jgi:hypothetical protein
VSDHNTPPAYVQSDDPIRKFQGRMVSVNGWQLPFAVRYVSWSLFLLVVFPLTLLGDRLLTGSISPIPLVDLAIAAVLTNRIANATSGETSLVHVAYYAARKVRAVRNGRRRTRSTTTSDRVRARRRHTMIQRTDQGDR